MPLRFIGVDPESGRTGSPTNWIHEKTGDLIAQSHVVDAARAKCIEKNAPCHDQAIPAGKTVIRIPAHLISLLEKAIAGSQ
ncbi:hypothetical protein AB0M64_15535 [Streptomyces sp. NPDC051771]|uniref:hypothetical protein n=1 Tax=Streptomyces sp. NPDC051771 TaxID=3154847 RepID=UPI00341D113A